MLLTNLKWAFSIVELLVVIALIGIVAAIVAPNMGSWACEEDIKKNSMAMNYLLQRGRNEAMNIDGNNVSRQVLAIMENRKLNLYSIPRGSCSRRSGTWIDGKQLDTGISPNPSSFTTCFYPDGSALGSSLTLTKQCSGQTLRFKNEVFGATGFIESTIYNSSTGKWDTL